MKSDTPRRPLERALRLVTIVRRGEAPGALLLTLDLAVLLFAYALLKMVREVLVLGAPGGRAEVKAYASAAQAILLVPLSLGFGALAARLDRLRLVRTVTLFFVVQLVAFAAIVALFPSLGVGIAFFIWIGCFNVLIIAQFWSVANDLHDRESGERLFPLIAVGSALGALAGSRASGLLYPHLGASGIMLLAAVLLVGTIALTARVEAHTPRSRPRGPVARTGGATALVRDPYLALVTIMTLLKNWVNSTGEYVLDRLLLDAARRAAGATADRAVVQQFIAHWKSNYLTWTNALVVVMQLFAVSRILRRLGVGPALLVLPIVAGVGFGAMVLAPSLGLILAVKVAENGIDYSLEKTAEQALYLVTSRSAKYRAKAIIDALVVRLGDVLAAGVVWIGSAIGLGTTAFVVENLLLVAGWITTVVLLCRSKPLRSAGAHGAPTASPPLSRTDAGRRATRGPPGPR